MHAQHASSTHVAVTRIGCCVLTIMRVHCIYYYMYTSTNHISALPSVRTAGLMYTRHWAPGRRLVSALGQLMMVPLFISMLVLQVRT